MLDWKDALGALKSDLPEGSAPEAGEAPAAAETHRILPKINFFYEKKGRAGKPATILEGFAPAMSDDEIEDVARTLKQRLGCGGSARGGEILLQGDRRQQAREILLSMGFNVK